MHNRHVLLTAIAAAGVVALIPTLQSAQASNADTSESGGHAVDVEVFAPEHHDNAGIEGKGWFVDLQITYPGTSLATAGFTGLQLTGPAAHNNAAPFPGTFSTGQDDRLPGLVVLTSTTNATVAGFSGPGTNLANLFNLTGVTDRSSSDFQLWDTWIVGAAIAGKNVDTTLTVAVVADLNHNGVYDDAPAVVSDLNSDGIVDKQDLTMLGVASNIVDVPFHINGTPAS